MHSIAGFIVLRWLAAAVRRAAESPLWRSRGEVRYAPTGASPRAGDPRWLRLSAANGIAWWLDFQSGSVSAWTAAEDALGRGDDP